MEINDPNKGMVGAAEPERMIKGGGGRNVGQQGVIICLTAMEPTWGREREREIKEMYDVF